MVVLIILSMVLVALFLSATIYHDKQIPDSVSAMVYTLPYTWRYLWTAWLWTVSMLLLPSLMESLGSYWQFLGFLWCASMAFCGALPLVKGEYNTTHNALGISAGILSQICVLLISPLWLLTWAVWCLIFTCKTMGHRSFSEWSWATLLSEGVCYISMVGALLFN